jgi:hypothetical protein
MAETNNGKTNFTDSFILFQENFRRLRLFIDTVSKDYQNNLKKYRDIILKLEGKKVKTRSARASKGYRTDKELLRKAIMKPHRTVCSPVNYEEERRTDIRDAFMEMMRKEFLDSSLENKNQMLDI